MIRINLLPFRAARKKENIRRQISIYVLSVAFLFIVMIYFFLQLNSTLNGLRAEEQKLQAELKTYEATIKRIAELEKKIKEIRGQAGRD
jgi:type IV pilus assembly protein PilN